ncbi:MAG: MurT ligase domain-containing protein [Erysipelotrichaceae bacterium]|nr:MurT ligase domain-containing protein [Erysipelotrichaceae bacterium]
MRKLLAIITCKILRFVGKMIKRGSSLPGKYALKIDPNILKKLKMPEYVIAVTGSNGKTSTVEMIYQVLVKAGYSVAYNKEGSNQIEGVTTFLLENATLSGRIRKDVVLIETDERYARHTFKHFVPTHYIITNLYRDQLTRNGHPEWIYDIIRDSIHDGSKLILNADEPLIATYGIGHKNKVYYFGVDQYEEKEMPSVYDDGKYCPLCKGRMVYDYRHFNHVGNYHCTKCGFKHPEANYRVTEVDLSEGYLVLDDKYRIELALKSIYNAYNILAAYSIALIMGIDGETVKEALNGYILRNGRVVEFMAGDKKGTLLTSKHENSISYDQSLRVAKSYAGDVTVFLMVDAISRKYFTSETSWLWDIDFEMLNSPNIKRIVIAGLYSSDVAERLLYADVDFAKVKVLKEIPAAIDYLKKEAVGHIYAITCFSDQDKLLSRVEVL